MGVFSKVEDRPTPPEVYNYKVYLCSAIGQFHLLHGISIFWLISFFRSLAAWAAVMIGYDSAFIGGTLALTSFRNEFGLTGKPAAELAFLSSNIVSTYQGGVRLTVLKSWPCTHLFWPTVLFWRIIRLSARLVLWAQERLDCHCCRVLCWCSFDAGSSEIYRSWSNLRWSYQ